MVVLCHFEGIATTRTHEPEGVTNLIFGIFGSAEPMGLASTESPAVMQQMLERCLGGHCSLRFFEDFRLSCTKPFTSPRIKTHGFSHHL